MSIALLTLVGSLVAADAATLSNGTDTIVIGPNGVVVAAPAAGLTTLDGPRLELNGAFDEWLGLSFTVGDRRIDLVAAGNADDWSDRDPLPSGSMTATRRNVVVTSAVDAAEVTSTFEFDRDRPEYVLVHVRVRNVGTEPMRDVLVSREWRAGEDLAWTFPNDIRGVESAAADIARLVWMTDDIPVGGERGVRMTYRIGDEEPVGRGVDVPLSRWTNVDFPAGITFGATNGISFGDYDADGDIDVFACQSGSLWENVGVGATWSFAQDLDTRLPATTRRYGASFGDYDLDGLPDIGTEPREGFGGDECYHLLRNLDGDFVNVATDPLILDTQPCASDAETLCWADVNGDGWMDAFLPVYPAWAGGGPGNFFMQNLGPTGPGGAFRFTENVDAVGLDNPPGSARPEGAQFVDLDDDGDVDLYCNGTLYQNNSTPSTVSFAAMTEAASGIGFSTSLEEGAAYVDYDLDGDQDLLIVYTSHGVRIFESYGDGSHFEASQSLIESPFTGLNLGLSAEDWDNDGDIDFTTRDVFRRNMLAETGSRGFVVASTAIPFSHRTSATPAWGDWDRDGDLDCALGNWLEVGRFYENTLYDDGTPDDDRRYVRVNVRRDDDTIPAGLEAEYGATVEVHVEGESVRRRKFVASSHGYLNQNEYALHFALPNASPLAGGDTRFDVTVDFSNPAPGTMWRVDKFVNPALGDVSMHALVDREIQVFRDGSVRRDGSTFAPSSVSPVVVTTTGGLATSGAATPLPAPAPVPQPNWYVGLAFDTAPATEPLRVKELILDGQLDDAPNCPDMENITLWDVTDPGSPVRVFGTLEATSSRNRRTTFRTDIVLPENRSYRLVARMTTFRESTAGPTPAGPIAVAGGLGFRDDDPCSGAGVEVASVDAAVVPLAIRVSDDATEPIAIPDVAASVGPTLRPPHPNPSAGPTALTVSLDRDADVRLDVFDVAGRRVRTIVDDRHSAGSMRVRWDGRDDGERIVAAGTYFVRLRVDGRTVRTERLVVVR